MCNNSWVVEQYGYKGFILTSYLKLLSKKTSAIGGGGGKQIHQKL